MARDGHEAVDEESNAIIYEGASVRQLAIMFSMDRSTVQTRLAGLAPNGRARGTAIYNIKQAAQRLVDPGYEIERYIMNMNHLDLPPLVGKEFWNGQRSRLTFETENGDLWRTADVVRTLSLVFLTYRMVAQTLPDVLEREAGLARHQKAVVRRVVDGALEDAREKIERSFEDYNVGGDVGAVQFDAPRYWAEDEDEGGTGVLEAPEVEDPNNGL